MKQEEVLSGKIQCVFSVGDRDTQRFKIFFHLKKGNYQTSVEYYTNCNLAHNLARDIKNYLGISMRDLSTKIRNGSIIVTVVKKDKKYHLMSLQGSLKTSFTWSLEKKLEKTK